MSSNEVIKTLRAPHEKEIPYKNVDEKTKFLNSAFGDSEEFIRRCFRETQNLADAEEKEIIDIARRRVEEDLCEQQPTLRDVAHLASHLDGISLPALKNVVKSYTTGAKKINRSIEQQAFELRLDKSASPLEIKFEHEMRKRVRKFMEEFHDIINSREFRENPFNLTNAYNELDIGLRLFSSDSVAYGEYDKILDIDSRIFSYTAGMGIGMVSMLMQL